MAQTTLISVRVENELLEKIDELLISKPYMKRSRAINILLTAILKCPICGQVDRLLDCYDPYDEGIFIHIYNKQGKPVF